MKISLVIPSRNNLRYFKWAYDAIRKNQGQHEVYICAADDASTDGTTEYFYDLTQRDDHFSYIINPGPERLGHTILYDRIIKDLVKTELAMIYHADMYLCPGALDDIEKYMFTVDHDSNIPIGNVTDENGNHLYIEYGSEIKSNYGTIVSLTRIEPPLHPPGPEKIIADFGVEPEEFQETRFLSWFSQQPKSYKTKTTNGIFAPWAFFVKDFLEIGGHDPLFAPQSREDSCIFNRFLLNGIKFIQTWEGCVYHMTCRGSRWNPSLTSVGSNSTEWVNHNIKSERNFRRKFGTNVIHNSDLSPVVKHKYNIGLVIRNCTHELIEFLEPFFATLYVDCSYRKYIDDEQPNTMYQLNERIKPFDNEKNNDIIISFDGKYFDNQGLHFLMNISDVITETNRSGEFEFLNFKITIHSLKTYELDLLDPKYNLEKYRIF